MHVADDDFLPDNDGFLSKDDWEAMQSDMDAVREDAARVKALFRKVFGSEDGLEVLEIICEQFCMEGVSAFASNATDMARNCGRQEVALLIRRALTGESGKPPNYKEN